MSEFVASNGGRVAEVQTVDDGARLTVYATRAYNKKQEGGTTTAYLIDDQVQALREFFLHEAGVWVDAQTGALVIPDRAGHEYVSIFIDGTMYGVHKRDGRYEGAPHLEVAGRYFAAHPEPLPYEDGIYAVSPNVHPYERLIQRRNGKWLHLYRSPGEAETDSVSAEAVARTAHQEGRLTRLVPEVSE